MAIDEASLRPVIGTLAHNRSFTAAEITQYTRFDRRFDGEQVVRWLSRRGYIERVDWGQWTPTAAGWTWIDGTTCAGAEAR